MLHRKVRHEVGLTAVMAAFLASWVYAGFPVMQASMYSPVAYYNELPVAVENADADRDGIPDYIDASPLGK